MNSSTSLGHELSFPSWQKAGHSINNGLNLVGMDTYVQSMVKGIVIVIAVSIVSRTSSLKLL